MTQSPLHPVFLQRYSTALLLCCSVVWLMCGVLVVAGGHDDSHITFWQAWTLQQHAALLNYNGARIEQSSSVLHVLLTCVLSTASPFSIVTSGYIVNIVGSLTTLYLLFVAAQRATPGVSPALPVWLTAASAGFAYWSFSGMETTLAAACVMAWLASVVSATQHTLRWTALVSGTALAAVRPEMPLVMLLVVCALPVLQRECRTWRSVWPCILLLVPVFLVSLCRYAYFGQWFPNPVYAKAELSFAQLITGSEYFRKLLQYPSGLVMVWLSLLLFIFALVMVWRDKLSRALKPYVLFVMLYGTFVLCAGGDWMKQDRFWVPLLAPAWLAIAAALSTVTPTLLRNTVCVILVVAQLSYGAWFFQRFNLGIPAWHLPALMQAYPGYSVFELANREHLRDVELIPRLRTYIDVVYTQSQQSVLVMSKQMGMINYHLGAAYFGKLDVLDSASLIENRIRLCPEMAVFGHDQQGVRMNYVRFFERLPFSEQACGLRAPDIIFDLYGWGDGTLPAFLESQGYRILFLQHGRVTVPSIFGGADITAEQLIAVNERWLVANTAGTEEIDFSQKLVEIFTK